MTVRDLTPLLAPRSVAVVGASGNLDNLAGRPLRHLSSCPLDLRIYPVNPRRDQIAGHTCYPDVRSLPEAPDAAIVLVPAAAVPAEIEALAERGARAAIVVSSGFAESGGEGVEVQRRLADTARDAGMILVGPNTLGVHDYAVGLALSFVWYGRRPDSTDGSVAVVSQSGSGMTSLCDRLLDAGLPVGTGIATGNEADLSLVDVVEHLAEQERVRVIAAVFEQLRDGPRFMAVCRRLRELGKPLVAMKVGRTEGGATMVRSHTGALAGAYPTLRAALRQVGVIEVTDLDDIAPMVAAALPHKLPRSRRIAMVTSSGGAAAIAADRADDLGMAMVPLAEGVQALVREQMPAFAGQGTIHNPIDLTAQSMERPNALVDIAGHLLADAGIDAVVAAVPSGGGPVGSQRGERLAEVAAASDKPLMAVILSGTEADAMRASLGRVPTYSSPGKAIEVLEGLCRFAEASPAAPRRPLPDGSALPGGADLSSEHGVLALLADVGLPVVEHALAATADAAVVAARAIGYPVAVKVSSPDILHKTESGGVVLDLHDDRAVTEAFRSVTGSARDAHPRARIDGVVVAAMVKPALELILGIQRDETLGATVLLGLGGIWAEALDDVSIRVVPIGDADVEGMVADLRGRPLLEGHRGLPPVKAGALGALLTGLSDLAERFGPRLASLDLNPVALTADGGLVILDALAVLEPDTGSGVR